MSHGQRLRTTRVLVTATTERVVDDVHRYTPDTRPVRCGVLHLVVLVPGLHERFFSTAATGDNPDCRTAPGIEPLGLPARHLHADLVFSLIDNDCLHAT